MIALFLRDVTIVAIIGATSTGLAMLIGWFLAWLSRCYPESELDIRPPVQKPAFSQADESLPEATKARRAHAEALRRESARIDSGAHSEGRMQLIKGGKS